MKKVIVALWAITSFLIYACNNPTGQKPKSVQLPKPGTIVASEQMPITDDTLNHFIFSVKIVADSNVAKGVYEVDVDFGPNYASGTFTLPKGAETFTPVIKKGTAPYTCIIGFKVPDDTTFYDYFEVTSNKSNTKMQYIKAYTF